MGPLIPDDSPRAPRVWRRVRGIAAEVIALTLVTLLSPVLVICAVAVDVALWLRRRKPWMAVRLLAMLWWFLVGELYGLLGLFGIWVLSGRRDGPRRRDRVYRLKRRWLASHLAGIRALFGLRFDVEGLELAGPGPVIVMIRHASIIDNALPDAIVGRAHGLGFPAAEVPSARDELIVWLYDRWQELDDWVGEMRSQDPGAHEALAGVG